jgi:hypothetical protein
VTEVSGYFLLFSHAEREIVVIVSFPRFTDGLPPLLILPVSEFVRSLEALPNRIGIDLSQPA